MKSAFNQTTLLSNTFQNEQKKKIEHQSRKMPLQDTQKAMIQTQTINRFVSQDDNRSVLSTSIKSRMMSPDMTDCVPQAGGPSMWIDMMNRTQSNDGISRAPLIKDEY